MGSFDPFAARKAQTSTSNSFGAALRQGLSPEAAGAAGKGSATGTGAPQPGSQNVGTGPTPAYYNQQGGVYDPKAGGPSYWFNTNENQWYQGQPGGQISSIQAAPWMQGGGATGGSSNQAWNPDTYNAYEKAFGNLAGQMSTGQVPQEWMNNEIAKFTEAQGHKNAEAQQRLATQLGASGAGAGASLLQALKRGGMFDTSQGVAGIYGKGLELGNANRGAALQAYLSRLGAQGELGATTRLQDINRELGLTSEETKRMLGDLDFQQAIRGQDLNSTVAMMNLLGQGYTQSQGNLYDYYRSLFGNQGTDLNLNT